MSISVNSKWLCYVSAVCGHLQCVLLLPFLVRRTVSPVCFAGHNDFIFTQGGLDEKMFPHFTDLTPRLPNTSAPHTSCHQSSLDKRPHTSRKQKLSWMAVAAQSSFG